MCPDGKTSYRTLIVFIGDELVGTFEVPNTTGWLTKAYLRTIERLRDDPSPLAFAQEIVNSGGCQLEDDRLIWWASAAPSWLRYECCEVPPRRQEQSREEGN